MRNKTFLITGSGGQLARAFQKTLTERRLKFFAPPEQELDITDFKTVEEVINKTKPDIIINCAAYNSVDEAEEKSDLAYLVNFNAVENLAKLCEKNNIFLVHYSSDYVFDGNKQNLYTEDDTPNPLNIYGESKLKGEEAINKGLTSYLIFRLSWVIGDGRQNFLYKIYEWTKNNRILKINSDEISVPTYTEDVVNVTLMSLKKGLKGLYHLTNSGYASRYELAKYFIDRMGLENIVVPVPASNFKTKARRPLFSAMSNKAILRELNFSIPAWEESINRFVEVLKKR